MRSLELVIIDLIRFEISVSGTDGELLFNLSFTLFIESSVAQVRWDEAMTDENV